MKNEARANKIEVQRGPIMVNSPKGFQMMSREETTVRDAYADYERKDGQMLKMMTPKQ